MFRLARAFRFIVVLSGCWGLAAPTGAADGPPPRDILPGWPDVFIHPANYDVVFGQPVRGSREAPAVYRQQATYTWMGGRAETLHITLARDPAFRERYPAAAVLKEKLPPRELEINGKTAWQWEFPRRAGGPFDGPDRRLVVLLADDKAIIVEQHGYGLSPEGAARQFDFARVAKALEQPPQLLVRRPLQHSPPP